MFRNSLTPVQHLVPAYTAANRRGFLMRRIGSLLACALLISPAAIAQISVNDLDSAAKSLQPKIISWRRDIHEHPELSNREVRTSQLVAKQLTSLGLQVKTGVGLTGVA